MDLETFIQREVSKKEKGKYCVLMHICGIWKDGTGEPICRAGIETQTENRHVHTVGERTWDKLGEQHWHTYTAMCEADSWRLLPSTGQAAAQLSALC